MTPRILPMLVLAACGEATSPTPRAYVSNENDGTISVIDTRTLEVVATIPVGKRPRGLRVTPDGKHLLVALSGSPKAPPGVDESTLPPPDRSADGIGVVDLGTLELTRTLESGQDPECFDLVGESLIVVSNEETSEASLVDLSTGTVRARVPVGGEPEGVTTRPDGEVVYVTSEEDHRIDVVDPDDARVIATVPTGQRPRAIAFTRDGARAYVSDENGGSVTVIDARAHRVVATVETGGRPMGVAIAPDGERVYVTTGRSKSIAVIDAADHRVVDTIDDVGGRPWGIAIAPDGRLFTANGPTDDVSVVDPATKKIVRIGVGGSPWGVAIH